MVPLASRVEQIAVPRCLACQQSSSAASGIRSGSARLCAQPRHPLHTLTARQTDPADEHTARRAHVSPWKPLHLARTAATHEARTAAGSDAGDPHAARAAGSALDIESEHASAVWTGAVPADLLLTHLGAPRPAHNNEPSVAWFVPLLEHFSAPG